jgi:hypothetical protein
MLCSYSEILVIELFIATDMYIYAEWEEWLDVWECLGISVTNMVFSLKLGFAS